MLRRTLSLRRVCERNELWAKIKYFRCCSLIFGYQIPPFSVDRATDSAVSLLLKRTDNFA